MQFIALSVINHKGFFLYNESVIISSWMKQLSHHRTFKFKKNDWRIVR